MCCDDILNIFGKLDSIYSEMYFLLSKSASSLGIRYCIYAVCTFFCLILPTMSVDKEFKGLIQFLMRGNITTAFSKMYLVLVYFQVI